MPSRIGIDNRSRELILCGQNFKQTTQWESKIDSIFRGKNTIIPLFNRTRIKKGCSIYFAAIIVFKSLSNKNLKKEGGSVIFFGHNFVKPLTNRNWQKKGCLMFRDHDILNRLSNNNWTNIDRHVIHASLTTSVNEIRQNYAT